MKFSEYVNKSTKSARSTNVREAADDFDIVLKTRSPSISQESVQQISDVIFRGVERATNRKIKGTFTGTLDLARATHGLGLAFDIDIPGINRKMDELGVDYVKVWAKIGEDLIASIERNATLCFAEPVLIRQSKGNDCLTIDIFFAK